MSDTSITAIIAAIPPTLLALGAFIQAWKTNSKADINQATTEASAIKLDAVINKTDEIHELSNSNMTEVKEQLAVASERIIGLEKALTALTMQKEPKK